MAGKSATIFKLLRRRRSQHGERRSADVYAVTSLVLFVLFAIGTILYCTKVLLSLKEAMCAVAIWDTQNGEVETSPWVKCRGVIQNGYLHYTADRALGLVFALNAQIILSIVNGILVCLFILYYKGVVLMDGQVYRCYKVFSDMWMVYVPIKAIYVLWVGQSFPAIHGVL